MNMTLTMPIMEVRTQLPMSLTLLALGMTMLVIITTVNTGERAMQGIPVIIMHLAGLLVLLELQVLRALPELTELQALMELPEQTVLQALTEQMGQQQLVLMVSQVEVEESLS
jgi:hypothetical protein